MRLSFRKSKPVQTGKLIAVEGESWASVQSQVQQLAHACEFIGLPVATLLFPTQEHKTQTLQKKLYGANRPGVYARALLTSCDFRSAQDELSASLKSGITVISSGYTVANAALHGTELADPFERVKFFRWLGHLENEVFGMWKPDMTFILDHEPMRNPGRKKHAQGGAEAGQVREVYRQLARLLPATKLIPTEHLGMNLTEQQIHNRMWDFTRRIVLREIKI